MSSAPLSQPHSTSPPATAGWLFGPVPDLLFGCGLAWIGVLVWQILSGGSLSALVPGALLVLAFSLPHYGATLLRVYEVRADRRRYALFAVYGSLLLLVLFVVGLRSPLAGSAILTVYLLWSPWHYTGQNYGIFLMLLGRRGAAVDGVTKRWVHLSFVLSYSLTFLAIQGAGHSGTYAPVSYAGTVYHLLPLGIPSDWLSVGLVALGTGYGVALAVVAVRLLRRASLGTIAPSLLLMLTQGLWFSVPVAANHWAPGGALSAGVYTAYGFLWIAAAHSVQYLWITTYYAAGKQPIGRRAIYLGKATLAGYGIWTLPALFFAPGFLGSLPHESGLALMVAAVVNLHHFVLDGVIWKLRDGRVARVLLRSQAPEARAEANATTPSSASLGFSNLAGIAGRALLWSAGIASVVIGLWAYWAEGSFRDAIRKDELLQALRSADQLEAIGRDAPSRRTQLGLRFAATGQPVAARHSFERSLELQPTAEAWRGLGLLAEESGDLRTAVDAFVAATDLDPQRAGLLFRAGRLALALGEPGRAVPLLERALAGAPPERRALMRLTLERARAERERAERSPGADPANLGAPS